MADSASNSCRKMYVGPFGLPFPKKLYYTGGGGIFVLGAGGAGLRTRSFAVHVCHDMRRGAQEGPFGKHEGKESEEGPGEGG